MVTYTINRTRIVVSENLACHFSPSLEKVCSLRDTFYRLTVQAFEIECFSLVGMWWQLAQEANQIIENLTPDYAI